MSAVDSIRNPNGIWINSQCFREEAIAFEKNGYYCPDPTGTLGWYEYWQEQEDRCNYGYSVGGAKITGHHYFYLNFSQIQLTKDKNINSDLSTIIKRSKGRKQLSFPDFWDGDYNYYWALEIADKGCTEEELKNLNLLVNIDPLYLTGGYHMVVLKARRKGFQQPYSEPIITPNGVTTMGELKVGDLVSTPTGSSKVLEKYEQGICDVYEITLQDGRKVKCGKDHLWKTNYNVIDTNHIIQLLETNKSVYIPSYRKKTNKDVDQIKNIKKLDYQEESACILIDSDDHLYLTTDFIVTHNSYKNSSMCANIYNTIPDSLVIIGAYEKKYLYPNGTMGMASNNIDFLNNNTGWAKAREFVNRPEHRKSSYKEIVNGIAVEKGFKSQIMAVTFQNNAHASRGKDAVKILYEEAGAFPNLLDSFKATKDSMEDGAITTGQSIIFGCVCAGTKVYNHEGKEINIENVTKESGIIGYAGNGVCKEPVTYLSEPAEKECYRITCSNNQIIECSDDHPLLYSNIHKYNKDKRKIVAFKKAKDIKIGEQLLLSRQVPLFGNEYLKYPRLVGLLIGDGYYGKNSTPQLAIADKGIKSFLDDEKIDYTIYKEYENYLYVGIRGFTKELRNIGIFGQTKLNKRLPNNYHKYNQYSLSELIGGYYDADGSISYNKKKNSYSIKLTSICIELLEEVKDVLYRFGISSSIFKRTNKDILLKSNINNKEYLIKDTISYSLETTSIEDVIEFKKHIYFTDLKKQKVLDSVDVSRVGKNTYNNCIFQEEIEGKGKFFINKELNNLKGVHVKKVEYIGKQVVYNLTADITHTYITNKFISANTSGDLESGTVDFAEMFRNPIQYDCMPFSNIWDERAERTVCGYFHPDNLNLVGFYDTQGNSDLEKAKKYELNKREQLRKHATSTGVLNSRAMEHPLCPSEALAVNSMNDFPVVELNRRLDLVKRENLHLKSSSVGQLYRDEKGNAKFKIDLENKLQPLWDYDIKDNNITGAVVIFEYPVPDAPKGLYKIAHDPYRQDQALNSPSIGSTYVYKQHLQGSFTKNIIVATYHGRPNVSDDYNRNLVMLAELYNAEVGYENEVTEVKSYFEKKKKLHLLSLQPNAVISANIKSSRVNRIYGIHMVEKLKDAAEKYTKQWLLTERDYDEEGNAILNLDTISDIGLLEELIRYNRKGNFDRVSAFFILMMYLENESESKKYKIKNEETQIQWSTFSKKLFKR